MKFYFGDSKVLFRNSMSPCQARFTLVENKLANMVGKSKTVVVEAVCM